MDRQLAIFFAGIVAVGIGPAVWLGGTLLGSSPLPDRPAPSVSPTAAVVPSPTPSPTPDLTEVIDYPGPTDWYGTPDPRLSSGVPPLPSSIPVLKPPPTSAVPGPPLVTTPPPSVEPPLVTIEPVTPPPGAGPVNPL